MLDGEGYCNIKSRKIRGTNNFLFQRFAMDASGTFTLLENIASHHSDRLFLESQESEITLSGRKKRRKKE
jgi:hypothetical protein